MRRTVSLATVACAALVAGCGGHAASSHPAVPATTTGSAVTPAPAVTASSDAGLVEGCRVLSTDVAALTSLATAVQAGGSADPSVVAAASTRVTADAGRVTSTVAKEVARLVHDASLLTRGDAAARQQAAAAVRTDARAADADCLRAVGAP